MPTSVIDAVADDIVATLQGIAVGSGWAQKTTPLVVRMKHPAYTLPRYPCAVVGWIGDTYTIQGQTGAVRTYQKVPRFAIAYWVESADMDVELAKVVHDVEKAFGADRQLGGTVDMMSIESSRVFLSDLQRPLCGVEFTLAVMLHIEENAPAVRSGF